MQILNDCDILEYSFSSELLEEDLLLAASAIFKPVYAVPILELCRAIHLLLKEHHINPQLFIDCYMHFSTTVEGISLSEGSPVHLLEFNGDNLILSIIRLIDNPQSDMMDIECQNNYEDYWDSHKLLISNLRCLYSSLLQDFDNLAERQRPWAAMLPDPKGKSIQVKDLSNDSLDILLDANNFLELANRLSVDEVNVTLPYLPPNTGLPQYIQQRFDKIFKSGGGGKFIVPLSVLEETQHVATQNAKYSHVIEVLRNMALSPDKWSPYFRFDPLNQEIFDYYMYLYGIMYQYDPDIRQWPGFGDMLILAHGLYHGCQIASNQWFWKKRKEDHPEWYLVGQIFPYLVLQPPVREM